MMLLFARTTSAQTSSPTTSGCIIITKNVYIGASDRLFANGNVVVLQNFLIANGYLHVNATGFYGPLTFAAVRNFQRDNGILAIGGVGPLTRARIQSVTCGTIPPAPPIGGAPTISYLSPSSGEVGTTVTVYGSRFNSNTTVSFGGSAVAPNVQILNANTLTFRVPEQLLPSCAYPTPDRPYVCMIAGSPTTPGNYQISVKNNNDVSNSVTFTVTNGSSTTNNAPTINGIDSPTSLSVNQTGTWTVRATDVTGGGLSYRVVWGDEGQYGQSAMSASAQTTFVQSATFTHAYSQAGIYTPRFYVRGSNGMTAEVSATVSIQYSNQTQSPSISSISPSSGPYGTVVTVYGSGFTRYNNSINYAGRTAVVTGVESTNGISLQFTIPATPCSSGMFCAQVVMEPGTYQVSVTNQNGTSNSVNYTLTSGGGSGSVNQTVSLTLGQTAFISGNNFQIKPVRIVEESRCPSGVYCIQAGRVVVETNIQSYDMIQVANLAYAEGSTNSQSSVLVDGYTVRITNVTPQARQGGLNSWEYVITYQVTK